MDDDVDSRVFGILGERDGSPTEDRDFGDFWCFDHGVEDCRPDETGCAGEDEMHCVCVWRGEMLNMKTVCFNEYSGNVEIFLRFFY